MPDTGERGQDGDTGMWKLLLILFKASRPPLWPALPLVFCMGLAYGEHGLLHPDFRFTFLMFLQMATLSFPLCLFTFGLNDIHDHASDRINPRKTGVEGTPLDVSLHKLVRNAAFAAGGLFFCVSLATLDPANIFYAVSILALSFAYSTPPWRLKTRPPLDVVAAGIIGFLAPFALGFSFVDNAWALSLQAYYFCLCIMGFHAFSTIMDYETDRAVGDGTFAAAYGKRAAALFAAAIFLPGPFMVREVYVKLFLGACAALALAVATVPSEKLARYSFRVMFAGAVLAVAAWTGSVMLF